MTHVHLASTLGLSHRPTRTIALPLSLVRPFGPWAALAVALLSAALSFGAEPFRKTYDIPAGLAERTLKAFSVQSGLEVVFVSRTVGQTRTNAVKGNLSAREPSITFSTAPGWS